MCKYAANYAEIYVNGIPALALIFSWMNLPLAAPENTKRTSNLNFKTIKLNNLKISFGSLTIRILDVGGTPSSGNVT